MAVKGLRVKINTKGASEVLSSAGVAADLAARGQRIAAAAGSGFEVRQTRNRDRAVVFVTAATPEARKAEASKRALTRAVDAGRG